MSIFFILTGLCSLGFSFLFLFCPNFLKGWNEYFNVVLYTDEKAITHRKKVGLALLFASFAFSCLLVFIF